MKEGIFIIILLISFLTFVSAFNDSCQKWACTQFSDCENGFMRRMCTEVEECDSNMSKPEEIQACGCSEDWVCDEWGDSSNECGTRICRDINNCGTSEDKPYIQKNCSFGRFIDKGWIIALFVLAIIVLVIFFRKKICNLSKRK